MTVLKVWKRVHCPKCQALIRVRFATDGSFILQDSKPSLHPPNEQPEQGSELTEVQLEQIRNIVTEALDKHLDEYRHEETPLTMAERDEETAQEKELRKFLNDDYLKAWLRRKHFKLKVGESFTQAMVREVLGETEQP